MINLKQKNIEVAQSYFKQYLVEASYAVEMQATINNTGVLRPRIFGGKDGFEFTFDFITKDDLKRRAFASGVIHNGHLFLIAYQAAALHYYDKHLPAVKRMLDTATIN